MEESEDGLEVLMGLVRSGYIKRSSTIRAAKKYLKGASPVMNKMALISAWKDGAWKHRLILDCRVSGTNSDTNKYERII